jgi:ArsR family transcriptional regulator
MALMTNEELCACQIIELLQFTGATVSRHLSQLNNASIIKSRKEGRWIYFRLNKESLAHKKFLDWLYEDLKNTKEYIEDCSSLKRIIACDPIILCKKQRGENCC